MKIDDSTEVPALTLAAALGLSRKRIEQLAAEDVIPRTAKGKFPLLAGVKGYVGWLKDEQRQANRSATSAELQAARVEDIRVRIDERLKIMQAAAIEEAIAAIDTVIGQLRSDLQSVPARATNDLKLRRRLETELNAVLNGAADRAAVIQGAPRADRKAAAAGKTTKSGKLGARKPRLSGKRRRSGSA